MTRGTYAGELGLIHAKTMAAYHRDGERTARLLVVFFTIVFAVEGWLWIDTGHPAYAFGAGTGLLLLLLGTWLHIHHGRKTARWEARTEQIEQDRREATRRDAAIHARHKLVADVIAMDDIRVDQISADLFKHPGHLL